MLWRWFFVALEEELGDRCELVRLEVEEAGAFEFLLVFAEGLAEEAGEAAAFGVVLDDAGKAIRNCVCLEELLGEEGLLTVEDPLKPLRDAASSTSGCSPSVVIG